MLCSCLIFIVVPIVEIYVIIQVGQAIGALWTVLLLIADSIIGARLLRGRAAGLGSFQDAMAAGRIPHREILDGVLIIIGGAFLLTPGFVTDIFGLLLLMPPTRAVLRRPGGPLDPAPAGSGGARGRRRVARAGPTGRGPPAAARDPRHRHRPRASPGRPTCRSDDAPGTSRRQGAGVPRRRVDFQCSTSAARSAAHRSRCRPGRAARAPCVRRREPVLRSRRTGASVDDGSAAAGPLELTLAPLERWRLPLYAPESWIELELRAPSRRRPLGARPRRLAGGRAHRYEQLCTERDGERRRRRPIAASAARVHRWGPPGPGRARRPGGRVRAGTR